MEDLEFIQRCIRKDRHAWEEFVVKYSQLIYNYIHSVIKIKGAYQFNQENIDDIFQEIFLSLVKDNFKKLKSFKARNGCSLASWLRQVTINFTIDHIRRHKAVVSLDEEGDDDLSMKNIITDGSMPILEQLTLKEHAAHLKECVENLDKEDKFFMELHFNRGIDLDALKERFKIARGAIDMRKWRLIERLRECFKSKGFELDF